MSSTPWFTIWPRACCVRGCSSQVFVRHPIWIGRSTPTICVTSHRRKRFRWRLVSGSLLSGRVGLVQPSPAWNHRRHSYLTGLPVNIVAARSGAYLNLAVPVSFYLLVLRLTGPPTAVASLAGLLFLVHAPTWAAPTYSPWLFGSVFAQSFFIYTATYCAASVSERPWRYSTAGILLGLTFLLTRPRHFWRRQ